MRFRVALLAASLLASPVAAHAQPFEGLYIGAGGGYNFLGPFAARSSPALDTGKLKFSDSNGFTGAGSVGYGFGNGVRIELEGDYRQNSPRQVSGTAFPTSLSGDLRWYGVMANALFDLDIGFPWLYPYIGIGAGYAWTNLDNIAATGSNFPFGLRANDTEGNFAYQVIAGLSFPVPDVPGLSLTTEYRFFETIGPTGFSASVCKAGRRRQAQEISTCAINTTSRSFSAFATPSTSPRRRCRRQRRQRPRHPRPPAPTSCSSTGTGPT